MSDTDALRQTFTHTPEPNRRQRRAARTRARALSVPRILLSLMMVPVVTVGLTASIYIRASDLAAPDALRHLLAMGGCDIAARLGVAPARIGDVGYHSRHDPDGTGVSCGHAVTAMTAPEVAAVPSPAETAGYRDTGGAKFLRP